MYKFNNSLKLPDELVFSFYDRLKEPEVLNVSTVRLDGVDEMLDHLLVHLVAQSLVPLEDAAHRLSFKQLKKPTQIFQS